MEKAKIKQTNKTNKFTKKKLKEMCTLLSSNRAQAFIYFKTSRREKEGRVAPLNSAMNVFLGMISAIEHCWVFKIFNAIIFFWKKHTSHYKLKDPTLVCVLLYILCHSGLELSRMCVCVSAEISADLGVISAEWACGRDDEKNNTAISYTLNI